MATMLAVVVERLCVAEAAVRATLHFEPASPALISAAYESMNLTPGMRATNWGPTHITGLGNLSWFLVERLAQLQLPWVRVAAEIRPMMVVATLAFPIDPDDLAGRLYNRPLPILSM